MHTLPVPVTLPLLLLLRLLVTVPETVTVALTLSEMVPDGEGEEVPDWLAVPHNVKLPEGLIDCDVQPLALCETETDGLEE